MFLMEKWDKFIMIMILVQVASESRSEAGAAHSSITIIWLDSYWLDTDPDRTEQYLPRAELSYRREKHREDTKNFTQARGCLCRAHIQSRTQTNYRGLQESPESIVIRTLAKTALPDRDCGNPYSKWHKLFEVQILVLHVVRITIGIPTVTISTGNFWAPSITRTPMDRSSRLLWVRSCAWNMSSTTTSSNAG